MSVALLGAGPVIDSAFGQLVAGLVPHSFASLDDARSVADLLAVRHGVQAPALGQSYRLAVSPGTVALSVRSSNRLDLVPEADRAGADPLEVAVHYASERPAPELVLFDVDVPRRSVITEWSRDSRRRMVRALAELDYAGWSRTGGTLAMLTLTLPGQWEWVAPTGQAFKRLVRVFRKRWARAIGSELVGLWKLEFQGRGAPHLHTLVRVPALVGGQRFEDWVARTWADVVRDSLPDDDERAVYDVVGEYARHLRRGTDLSFSGVRFSDPRRTAIYFLKHSAKSTGSKEYQHTVPEPWQAEDAGPGRFWGYWGLSRAVATVEVGHDAFIRARRILRHVARSRASVAVINRIRSSGEGSVWSMRRPRARAGFGSAGGGWVLVNDGLALAWDVGRALALPQP